MATGGTGLEQRGSIMDVLARLGRNQGDSRRRVPKQEEHGSPTVALCSNTFPMVTVYHYLGPTSTSLFLLPSRSLGSDTPIIRTMDTGPGLDFVEAVKQRCDFFVSTSDRPGNGNPRLLQGHADSLLIERFVEGHPYFGSEKLDETSSLEMYREKMAFYLVKNGVDHGLSNADIVATAAGLVAESLLRRHKQRLGDTECSASIILGTIKDDPDGAQIVEFLKAALPEARVEKLPRW